VFQKKVAEKIKTHILCSITYFQQSFCFWDNVEKYGTARQVTDDNVNGMCVLHAGYVWLQTHAQNMQ
jgi:hypothetical protein